MPVFDLSWQDTEFRWCSVCGLLLYYSLYGLKILINSANGAYTYVCAARMTFTLDNPNQGTMPGLEESKQSIRQPYWTHWTYCTSYSVTFLHCDLGAKWPWHKVTLVSRDILVLIDLEVNWPYLLTNYISLSYHFHCCQLVIISTSDISFDIFQDCIFIFLCLNNYVITIVFIIVFALKDFIWNYHFYW